MTKKQPKTSPEDGKAKPRADWEAIAKDYRAGTLSIRAIAAKHGVSDKAIRDKAKGDPNKGIPEWTRDLSDRIRQETRSALVRTAEGGNDDKIVAEKVQEGVAIIRTHQTAIRRHSSVVELLLAELEADTMKMEDIEAFIEEETKDDESGKRRAAMLKAVSLGNRAQTVQSLSNTLKTLVALQRQAHGIDANPEPPKDELADLLASIDGKTAGLPFQSKE
jgi:hypothetical protein